MGKGQKNAFEQLKVKMGNVETLAYFDVIAPTQVVADASPVGIGAVLIQQQAGARKVCVRQLKFN